MNETQTSAQRLGGRLSRPVVRRGAAAGLAVGAVALVGAAIAPPASASEFLPDPEATVVAACGPTNGEIAITLDNTGGLEYAHFAVAVTAHAPTDHVVAPGGSESYLLTEMGDGFSGVVTITADFGQVVQQAFGPFGCNTFTSQLTPRCNGTEAYLDLHVDRLTGAAGAIYVDVDDERVADDVPVSSWDHSLAVPVGVPLDVEVTDYTGVVQAAWTEPISCAQAVDTSTTSTTEVPPADSEVPPAAVGGSTATASPAAVAVEATLPVTGSTTAPLVAGGGILIGVGFGGWWLARRQRRAMGA